LPKPQTTRNPSKSP